jgi:cyclic pyranopterin monophosphate synthase
MGNGAVICRSMPELTHVNADGNAHMVDVGDKAITKRVAIAEGWIQLSNAAAAAVKERRAAKGDVLATAQLAGIQAAKRTSDLIPLCHTLPLSAVDVTLDLEGATNRVYCQATAQVIWRTGVEMEALTAVSVALLTVYDMVKAIDRSMVLGPIQLLEKSGGRSGHWVRLAEK